MIKKVMLSIMMVTAVTLFMVSCDNAANSANASKAANASSEVKQEAVAGTYAVDNDSSVGVTKCNTTSDTLKIEAVSGSNDKVNITLPNVVWTPAMTISSFTVHNVVVSTTDNENYTFTLGEFSETATESDGTKKTVVGTSVSGTFVKSTKTISVTATYKYGNMPMQIVQVCSSVETLSVDATLSCHIDAMGGQEFGTPVHKGTKILKKADGTYKVLLSLGKGTGNIYGVEFDAFIDPRISKPGYYDADGNVQNATYTVSEDDTATPPSTDEDAETGVHYVTSMTFPVSKEKSEYNLWIYINSNMMGVQFCDGSGTVGSGDPNVASKYVGKLTIDWSSLK